jgi:hypothetical protein
MPLDGFPHASPLFVAPIAHAPDSPFGPDALSGSLVNAYYASRRNGVRLGEQAFGRSSVSQADEGSGRWIYSATTPSRISRSRAYVHALTSRAWGTVLYQCVSRSSTRVRLQLRARYVSGGLGNGPEVVQTIGPTGGQGGGSTGTNTFSLQELSGGWYVGLCYVDLTTGELNTVVRFEAWAYAENGSAIAFRPWRVAIDGEVI